MTIVCAIDFSTGSSAALAAAGALASRGEELWIVHALDSFDGAVLFTDLVATQRDAEQRLEEVAMTFETTWGSRARPLLLHGSAGDVIAELAETQSDSLVVIGSPSRVDHPGRRAGRTSHRLAARLKRPMLAAREAAPFEAWSRRERPLRMMLGLDDTRSWESALDWTSRMRLTAPCDVIAARVYDPRQERRRYGLPPYGPPAEPDREIEALLTHDMRIRVGTLRGQGETSFLPVRGGGRRADHVLSTARSEDIDVLVLGSPGRASFTGLASIANLALHYGDAAVLLVPLAPESTPQFAAPRRVLVATDLSPSSNRAIAHASALLEGRGGEVIVLHVCGDPERQTQEVEAEMQKLRALVEGRGATTARIQVASGGHPARAICEAAERFGADIVCVASHGRTGVSRVLFGSVTEDVLRHCKRPVLVVHPPPA